VAAPRAAHSAAAPQPIVSSAIAQPADLPVGRLPGSQRKRGMLMTLGAVAGFFALAALGLMSSKTYTPKAASAARSAESTKRAAPAATPAPKPQPVQAPAPPPSAPTPTAPTEVAAPTPVPSEAPVAAAAPTPAPSEAPTAPAPTSPPLAALAGQKPAPPATDLNAAVAYSPAAAAPASAKPSAAATAPRVPPAAAVAEKKPVARPATVRIRISASPAQAALTLDGETIPNPFEADVVKGAGKHRVQASAPGRRSSDVTVKFDQDRVVELKLSEVRTAAARPRRQRPPRTTAAPPRTPRVPNAQQESTRGAGFVSESPY
jgi:hypothetical protein